ncbi:unnamed protein product, partial [Ectocarpus sp. 12 AP-2014]
VVAAQRGTKWITKEEAAGNVYQSWIKSVVQLLGEKSISTLGTQEEAHAIGRKVFSEALSAKAIIKLQPILESALQKVVLRWEECAKTGQEVEIQDDITDFTLESIAAGLFGEYATPNFMSSLSCGEGHHFGDPHAHAAAPRDCRGRQGDNGPAHRRAQQGRNG